MYGALLFRVFRFLLFAFYTAIFLFFILKLSYSFTIFEYIVMLMILDYCYSNIYKSLMLTINKYHSRYMGVILFSLFSSLYFLHIPLTTSNYSHTFPQRIVPSLMFSLYSMNITCSFLVFFLLSNRHLLVYEVGLRSMVN